MSKPITRPMTLLSRVKDTAEYASWLLFFTVGGGGVMATLAAYTPHIHWAMVFLLSIGTMCLIALTFTATEQYIRVHAIDRCIKFKNIIPTVFIYDGARNTYSVILTGSLENSSKTSWIFVKLVHGHIALHGNTPIEPAIEDKIIEIGPESSARIDFPMVPNVPVSPLVIGQIAVGVRFGRSKKKKTYVYYTEGRLEMQITKDENSEIRGILKDYVTEASYGRSSEEDDV